MKIANTNIELINKDCKKVIKQYEDNYFDIAIVDPPYGIGNFSQGDRRHNVKWNNSIPEKRYFSELKRISKIQIIWGANYFNCFNDSGGAIIWNKLNTHPTMSKCEIASVSNQKRVQYCEFEWNGAKRCESWKIIHPCQKPIKLYNWIYANYTKPGQKVLDTHLGSGSNAIAAHYAKCSEFVGIELDKEYFDLASDRIFKETRQMELF